MNDFGTIAGIISGYKAGQITEATANKLLKSIGCDNTITTLVSAGAGLIGGILLGDIVSDAVSDILGDLFD